jgi:ankyrin repeat protein
MGIDGRDVDIEKTTPLMYAAMAGRLENIKFLL